MQNSINYIFATFVILFNELKNWLNSRARKLKMYLFSVYACGFLLKKVVINNGYEIE